jgi:hypothetical protein
MQEMEKAEHAFGVAPKTSGEIDAYQAGNKNCREISD